jgi:pyruvate/2-oxoglutarate dehydrogenase complex dihydrolipoamide dehydrogenase (E3) component
LSQHFDAIVIGTGQAGPSLAARFAAAGKTVAIIERHKFGGTCVNTGCIRENMTSPILVTGAADRVGAGGRTITELVLKQGKAVRERPI